MKSRWFRFSLRTLLLLITALCVWLGIQVNAARRQRDAVAKLQKASGEIYYDYQMVPQGGLMQSGVPPGIRLRDEVVFPDRLPPGPAWLRKLIGDDCFRTVVAAHLSPKVAIQKADLDALVELPYVREFCFVGSGTGVSDKDFAALSELRRLETLQFINARIDGSFLASLPNPRRLKTLYIYATEADDGAIEHIEKMKMLEDLSLSGTHITDAGLVHLRDLKNLVNLWLEDTNVSDAGLGHLDGLKKLTVLSLQKTQVSESGLSQLRAALPKCNIVWP